MDLTKYIAGHFEEPCLSIPRKNLKPTPHLEAEWKRWQMLDYLDIGFRANFAGRPKDRKLAL